MLGIIPLLFLTKLSGFRCSADMQIWSLVLMQIFIRTMGKRIWILLMQGLLVVFVDFPMHILRRYLCLIDRHMHRAYELSIGSINERKDLRIWLIIN